MKHAGMYVDAVPRHEIKQESSALNGDVVMNYNLGLEAEVLQGYIQNLARCKSLIALHPQSACGAPSLRYVECT